MSLHSYISRLAEHLLRFALPDSLSSTVFGDLLEEARERAASRPRSTRFWLLTQSLLISLPFLFRRLLRGISKILSPSSHQIPGQPPSPRKGDPLVRTLWNDLRFGLRMLRKSPGFTVVAVLTLALGIGATTAIFSVVYQVILRSLPYRDPDSIITVWERNPREGLPRDDVSPANFLDWKERQTVFQLLAFSNPWSLDYIADGEPESVQSVRVSEDFFEIFGARPLHGRTFLPEDFQPGRSRVVILSHGYWKRRFGSDPSLVGRTLTLDDQPYIVIGILPPEFDPRLFPREREMYEPQVPPDNFRFQRRATYLKVVGRLKPGVTLPQAQSAMDSIASQLAIEYPQTNSNLGINLVPLNEHLVGNVRPALWIFLGASAFVLLIACANVANLLLARGTRRERELAIRSALGASRSRILRQLVTESVLLSFLGGAFSLLLAYAATKMLIRFSPVQLPGLDRVSLDPFVLLFAALVSVVTALIFGLLPALQVSHSDPQSALKESTRGATAGRLRRTARSALVVSEVALALILLVGAGLLLRSFVSLLRVDPGFAADRVVAVQAFIWSRYNTPDLRVNFVQQAVEKMAAIPGVQSAGASTSLPFLTSSISTALPVAIEGKTFPPGQEPTAFYAVATPTYFETIGVPLRQGRVFTPFDKSGAQLVAVINDEMARRFWPNENPLGRRFSFSQRGQLSTFEVVGIVGNVRPIGLASEPRPEFFMSHAQSPTGSMIFIARTSGDPAALLPSVKSAIWELNRTQPFYATVTVEQLLSASLARERFNLILLGAFSSLALVLAAVGIYGVISFSTAQRTQEMGIRIALGAQSADIFRIVLSHGMSLAFLGVAIGLAVSFALSRVLRQFLFAISPVDPLTYAAICTLLLSVAFLACYLPARRATRTDPLTALRYE